MPQNTFVKIEPTYDIEKLLKLDRPLPRYTSYPTAPEWGTLSAKSYQTHLAQFKKSDKPLSLYFHIPFCRNMCLYCGCSVILNRRDEIQKKYVDYLFKEIDLIVEQIGRNRPIHQIHFGGGTPTQLSEYDMKRLFQKIESSFALDHSKEIAIEIDPRTVSGDEGKKLRFLRELGFNRVSFGVQDTNQEVQEAVKRRQSLEQTLSTYDLARSYKFNGINIDLIYGLPFQTRETFKQTIDHIVQMRPDRIAMYSYAKIPWLKSHQKAIKEESLPSTEEKFRIYVEAREKLTDNGYVGIGMDHFVLAEDEMGRAFENQTLHRNFQGYAVKKSDDLIGIGITATGFVSDSYFQNVKELDSYYELLERGTLPVLRGKALNHEDKIRQWVISTLMCRFELDKAAFYKKFAIDFDHYFAEEIKGLSSLIEEGLLENSDHDIKATAYGRLFVRNIASLFDGYLKKKQADRPRFSKAI